MSGIASAARVRILPHGPLDLLRQLAIWFGFLYAYRYTRGVADRDPFKAFHNGLAVADLEHRFTGLWELSLQSLVASSDVLREATSWTYWHSQFTVLGLSLLWIYLWRNEAFVRVRNTLLLANIIGLVGYVVVPTAPPRMFPTFGFPDTLANIGSLNHGSGFIQLAANPYAAMPSLHAADALIVGISMALVARRWWAKVLWLLWPAWVWFAVMATGNHFWLDCIAGVGVALIALTIVYRRDIFRIVAAQRA